MENKIKVPEEVECKIDADLITIRKGEIELKRKYPAARIKIVKSGNLIEISSKFKNRKNHALVGTFNAHIKNMIKGVEKPFLYKLKICSSHFPMSAKVSGKELIVENFIGSKKPKKIKIPEGAKISVNKDVIEVTSANIELAGQAASRIEQSTKLRNKDRRVFQDGIYITNKAGKKI